MRTIMDAMDVLLDGTLKLSCYLMEYAKLHFSNTTDIWCDER